MTITLNPGLDFVGIGLTVSGSTDTAPPDGTDVQVFINDPTGTFSIASGEGATAGGGSFAVRIGHDGSGLPTNVANGQVAGAGVQLQVVIVGFDTFTDSMTFSWDPVSGLWNLLPFLVSSSPILTQILNAVQKTY